MSNVDRYKIDAEGYMIDSPNGQWVDYEDYAELQQKLDSMAAENGVLKSALEPKEISDKIQDLFNDTVKLDGDSDGYHEWSWVDNPDEVIIAVMNAMPKPETPATDAHLNSVRADAVEAFTADVVLKMRESGAGTYDYADIVEAQGQELVLSLRSCTHDTADKAG